MNLSKPGQSWKMSQRDWLAVLGSAFGAFLAILDIQITNASLREIQSSLELDFFEGGWISTGYLIAEIAIIPLTAQLAEVFGLRRCILAAGIVFLVSSVACGFAGNFSSMIFFRAIQGLSGGALIPLSFQTMLVHMPTDMRPIGLSIFGLTATLAPTLGPSIGGYLTDEFGWRWNFFMNLFPGALMMIAVMAGFPKRPIHYEKLRSIDWLGALFLAVALGALTYVLEDGAKLNWFEDRSIQNAALVAGMAAVLFVASQSMRENKLLDYRLFKRPSFTIACWITLLAAAALFGGIYSLSLFLGRVQGYSASDVGKTLMWVGIPQLFVMPLLPFLMRKVPPKILIVVGLGIFAWSNVLNGNINTQFGGDEFRFSLMVRALGQPLFLIPLSVVGMSVILPSESGSASAIFNVMRNIGGSIGIASASTLLTTQQSMHHQRHFESIGSDAWILERLRGIQHYFWSLGLDREQAQSLSVAWVNGASARESVVQAFGDIFLFLAILVTACVFLALFLRKTAAGRGSMGGGH